MRWPVEIPMNKTIPSRGEPGGFLEHRGDRKHCGLDIYAEQGCNVFAIESGVVIFVDIFTSKEMIPYWNTTYQIIIKGESGLFYRFAELNDFLVKRNEQVTEGQIIGHVGQVLHKDAITEKSPLYIQRLKKQNHCSMLHLEIYNSEPIDSEMYLGGNWFGNNKPEKALDPAKILKNIM